MKMKMTRKIASVLKGISSNPYTKYTDTHAPTRILAFCNRNKDSDKKDYDKTKNDYLTFYKKKDVLETVVNYSDSDGESTASDHHLRLTKIMELCPVLRETRRVFCCVPKSLIVNSTPTLTKCLITECSKNYNSDCLFRNHNEPVESICIVIPKGSRALPFQKNSILGGFGLHRTYQIILPLGGHLIPIHKNTHDKIPIYIYNEDRHNYNSRSHSATSKSRSRSRSRSQSQSQSQSRSRSQSQSQSQSKSLSKDFMKAVIDGYTG